MTPPVSPDRVNGDSDLWPGIMATLVAGRDLDDDQARGAIMGVLDGTAGDARLAALLVGLAAKGVTSPELAAMVDVMVTMAEPLPLTDPSAVVDIVGTGGAERRRSAALNVSTMACFVAAGAGATICKHGNRRASSTSGSFDLLEQLGVPTDLDAAGVRRCVDEVGVGFAFARMFHPAMRHAAAVRSTLGIPTVFNVLGPLAHPAGVTRSVLGVSDPALAPLMADVMRRRGAERAMVVCGHGDTDELVTTGPTLVHELRDGEVQVFEFDPASVGLTVVDPTAVAGGSPERNADIARDVFAGREGPMADMVALNAAAALVVAGAADSITDGLDMARTALADGAAAARLDALVGLGRQLSTH
jgi:anthranilate phosphoribosyltransferase